MPPSEAQEAYEKYAPRWFKVIRWREWADRTIYKHKLFIMMFWIPTFYIFFNQQDPYYMYLAIKQPQTEEERLQLKRDYNFNVYQKNWKIDQYSLDAPPKYDVWLRRRKYPEHYGDKYNTFKMDNVD